MRHLLTLIICTGIAIATFMVEDWKDIDLSLSIPSEASTTNKKLPKQLISAKDEMDSEDESALWIDTIMCAKGHTFGYRGDLSIWGGWYVDTICVGEDQMLSCDSVGPSRLKLSLITREVVVDLGDTGIVDKIRMFLNPIKGFKRFRKEYKQCLDSVTDEEYGTWKYMGEFSFTVDYPDSGMVNASKIHHFICELTCISDLEKAKISSLSAFYAGFEQTKNYRPVYTGNPNDMKSLSDFLAHRTFENWILGGEFGMGSSAATLVIRPHILTDRYVTIGKYEYDRMGIGHGGYTESFHTFNLKTEKQLTNKELFKSNSLDKVKMRLFEVMANDPKYLAWHEEVSPKDIEGMIEGWRSPDPLIKGTDREETQDDFKFELPDGALTESGVVFSFQPYEIDCWAAGAYHFIVPYRKLMPFLTSEAKGLISCKNSK